MQITRRDLVDVKLKVCSMQYRALLQGILFMQCLITLQILEQVLTINWREVLGQLDAHFLSTEKHHTRHHQEECKTQRDQYLLATLHLRILEEVVIDNVRRFLCHSEIYIRVVPLDGRFDISSTLLDHLHLQSSLESLLVGECDICF